MIRQMYDPDRSLKERTEQYLQAQSFARVSNMLLELLVPEDLKEGISPVRQEQAPYTWIPPSLSNLRDYYDKFSVFMDFVAMSLYEQELTELTFIAELVRDIAPNRVIEAGCGTGLNLTNLAQQFPKTRFTGYDLSSQMVERTKDRIRDCPNAEAEVLDHLTAGVRFGGAADLIISKASLNPTVMYLPDFSRLPAPYEAWDEFSNTDPTMLEVREVLKGFAGMLLPGGRYVDIGICEGSRPWAIRNLAAEAGLIFDESMSMVIFMYEEERGGNVIESQVFIKA